MMERNLELLEKARTTIITRIDLQKKTKTTKEEVEEVQNQFDKIIEELKENDFNMKELSLEKAKSFGFRSWDSNDIDQEGRVLYLIPFWMFKLIPIGVEVESIFGEKEINNGTNLDDDHRMGCLAYGFRFKEDK